MWPFKRKQKHEFLSSSDTDLGNVLLKLGYVTQGQLDDALRHQRLIKGNMKLGELLMSADVIDESELDRALEVQGQMRAGHAAAVDAMLQIVSDRSERVMASMCAPSPLKKAV